jgi:hypothetical protein
MDRNRLVKSEMKRTLGLIAALLLALPAQPFPRRCNSRKPRLSRAVTCGVKTRNSQDFPAAGLRWMVKFEEGNNRVRVVSRKGSTEVVDQITTFYQTRKFGKPTHFELSQSKVGGLIPVEAWLMDTGGIICVEARNAVRFELAGDGLLIDNLGTVRGSREAELCNGRVVISMRPGSGKSGCRYRRRGCRRRLLVWGSGSPKRTGREPAPLCGHG